MTVIPGCAFNTLITSACTLTDIGSVLGGELGFFGEVCLGEEAAVYVGLGEFEYGGEVEPPLAVDFLFSRITSAAVGGGGGEFGDTVSLT